MGHCNISTTPAASPPAPASVTKKRGEGQYLMWFDGASYPYFTALEPDVNPLPTCLAKSRPSNYMSQFLSNGWRYGISSPAQLILPDGSPVFCEGYMGPYISDSYDNEEFGRCMKYNMTGDVWTEHSTTPHRRSWVGFDFDPKFGLITAGGRIKIQIRGQPNVERAVDDVHISKDFGLTFEELPPLPRGADNYAYILWIDEKTVFYASHGSNRPFYFLDLESKTWTEGPALRYKRHGYVGLVTRASGEKEIVFVGGKVYGTLPPDAADCVERCNQYVTKTVEIYNIANNTLRMGKDAPQFWPHVPGTTTQYMDSFIVSPNKGSDDCCDGQIWPKEIWRYNDDETFTKMPGKHAKNPYINNPGIWVDDLC